MNVWEWVLGALPELREAGHGRLADLLLDLPSSLDGQQAQTEALAREALALARAIGSEWIEIYVRHWDLHRRDLLEDLDVAQQQRRLREDGARVARVAKRLPDPRHELVARLNPLIRIGVRPHRDVLALPRRPPQLGSDDLGRIDLDDDLALEVAAGVEVEVLVGRASEAVDTSMAASAIRVDRPAKRHHRRVGDAVDRRLGVDLVEAHVERLGRVEAADRGRIAVSGQSRRVVHRGC